MQPDGDRVVHSRVLADRVLAALSRPELRNVLSLKIDMQPDSAAILQVEMIVSERVAAELETALVQFELVPKATPGAPVSAAGPADRQNGADAAAMQLGEGLRHLLATAESASLAELPALPAGSP